MLLILIILLVLAFAGSGPWWPHAQSWGYAPSGIVGLLLVVLLVYILLGPGFGHIRHW